MERFEELVSAGISRQIADALAAHYGPQLLPLQRQALEQTRLLAGESLLVSAPTASGKTLLAELAAIAQIQRSRLALYLVPTRALAEQKASEFHERLAPLGLRVACSTRDRREQDAAILRGEIHLTVAVYEKALGLLCRQPGLMERLGLLAADEIQLLGDAERGGEIDLFLTRWKMAPHAPQLVALSAVLGNPEELADWLRIPLFRSEIRPVPLREGVLDLESGVYRWRERGTGLMGREALLTDPAELEGDRALAALEQLARNHGPMIFFAATRSEAVRTAFSLAEDRPFSPARKALAELAACEAELSRERLEALLPHGVGLHTADMPCVHRQVVERAFQRGELPVLVATPTLEQGVNLAAATVVHVPLMIQSSSPESRATMVPLSRARLLNQGGRAGRCGTDVGRSIIFVRGEFEADQAWRTFIAPNPEPIESPLGRGARVGAIAEIVRMGGTESAEGLSAFFASTFAARRNRGALEYRLDQDLETGCRYHFWRLDESRSVRLTGLGEVLALTGILPQTAALWMELLTGAEGTAGTVAALFFVCLAEEWEQFPLRVEAAERRHNRWPVGLRERLGRGTELARRLDEHLQRLGGAPFTCHRAARRALLLDDWLGGLSIADLELEHGLASGQMARLAGQAAWLMAGAAELGGVLQLPQEAVEEFELLSRRLAELDRQLSRSMVDLTAAPPERVRESGLIEARESLSAPAEVNEPRVVRLRFPQNDPGAIEFDGETIQLTPIQYQLLELLARNTGATVSYQQIHDEVWRDAFVEQQMIPYHRKRLEKSLGIRPGELIETRPRWGLALNLDPRQVIFREGDGESLIADAS